MRAAFSRPVRWSAEPLALGRPGWPLLLGAVLAVVGLPALMADPPADSARECALAADVAAVVGGGPFFRDLEGEIIGPATLEDRPWKAHCLPTFQRRELVADTVLALSRQNFTKPFEAIVVVDGSTDGTAKRLRELDPTFPLKVIEQEHIDQKIGIGAAISFGLTRFFHLLFVSIIYGLVVFVGFLMLAGAVNTSIVGSTGVLTRVAEDGVLLDWFRHPHKRYGTNHRIVNLVAILDGSDEEFEAESQALTG